MNWAIDPKTGLNNMMYPDWQYWYWFRSVFYKKSDFVYREEQSGCEITPRTSGSWLKTLSTLMGTGALVGAALISTGLVDQKEVVARLRGLDPKVLVKQLSSIRA